MSLDEIQAKVNATLDACSIYNLGEKLAKAQVVDVELGKYNPQIQSQQIATRREKAIADCYKILADGVETLRDLYAKVQSLRRKQLYPLAESISPNKWEESRYLDRRALDMVRATKEMGSVSALVAEMNSAKTFPEADYSSYLYSWSKIYWSDAPLPELERLTPVWVEYEKATNLKAFDTLLHVINENIRALENRNNLVANPDLLRPANALAWETSMRLAGLAKD
jgi:hypothetical protein